MIDTYISVLHCQLLVTLLLTNSYLSHGVYYKEMKQTAWSCLSNGGQYNTIKPAAKLIYVIWCQQQRN